MFGYIKLDSGCPRILNSVFKKNYCLLCRSIEKNYGQVPRMLLSYDVTFLLMLFTDGERLENVKKVHCFGQRKELSGCVTDEVVKKCAALNLAMAEAELRDHINDDKSLLAKTALGILRRPLRKVGKEYPEMRQALLDGYAKFDEYEKADKSIDEIEDMFAELIVGIAVREFGLDDPVRLGQLAYVAKWLYFIDACDDLDKDIKSGAFNALKRFGSCRELFEKHYDYVSAHLDKIRNGIAPFSTKDINRQTTNRIVFCGISESTYKVAMRIKEHEVIC